MYNRISWDHSQHKERAVPQCRIIKKLRYWFGKKSPWKEAFTYIYYLSRQTEEVFYPHFIDEETKNHLRPLPRVLITGQSMSFHSLTDSSLPPKERSRIHYLFFKTVSHSKTLYFSLFPFRETRKKLCVCVHACAHKHMYAQGCMWRRRG